MSKAALFIPLAAFILLAFVLGAGFFLEDPHRLPSVLVGKPLPQFKLADVKDLERWVTSEDLLGEVTLLNVWATWCPSCVAEHQQLLKIAREGTVRLVGVNYNDDVAKAQQWLLKLGDPYWVTLADTQGKLGIDLGVYGAPETFLMDASGVIHFRHVGAVTDEIWQNTLRPMVLEFKQNGSQGE
ncbi:MAG: DsbE family thiol:disulfide interchange protein [Pseudomonadales bacterium]|nr:DsbE family thiol:disulfide interchange protein [Pseudomonadales bacterium]MDP7360437.1 DsbE family thiol:disulfide interchange protein [Pseudomonadales bacterium]MDP7594178.1 DsbE family thiol:disulfide interchange protein [Pseudomonadales bacterium]HJN52883.1 DsbE family thiol:disulfide interchange protein [Pseudomonadales bacterium]